MSLAKVHRAAKARKVWTCGKCGTTINVGEPVLSYSVGFRGYEQRRCDKKECYPTRSERESSMVSSVYDAIDSADWSSANEVSDLQEMLGDIAGVMREVAGDYENSEMFERNPDLQERAEMLNSGADDLEGWEPQESEPQEDNKDTWDGHSTFEDAHLAWFETVRAEAQQVADEAETP